MKKKTDIGILFVGMILLAVGIYFVGSNEDPEGIFRVLPFVCIGIGCGLFGHGMGSIISRKALKGSPEIARQIEIEKKDERNLMLASRAKAKGFDMMTFAFGALIICFALMGISLAATLLLVFTYLFVEGYAVYYRCKLEKMM